MRIFKSLLRKSMIAIITGSIISLMTMQPLYAQQGGAAGGSGGMGAGLLAAIKKDTGDILTGINNIPIYIGIYFTPLYMMATSWIAKDTKSDGVIPVEQALFAALNNEDTKGKEQQEAIALGLTKQLLLNGNPNPKKQYLPLNANYLNYGALSGRKLDPSKDKDVSPDTLGMTYIQNLSGTNFRMTPPITPLPGIVLPGNYQSFYNSTMAIQSYNTHILTGLLGQKEKNSFREYLITQASSSDWFKTVATEELGLVLRHILMYDSQIFVQLHRLEKLQREQVAAQAMTNTLLIFQNSQTVGEILRRTGG